MAPAEFAFLLASAWVFTGYSSKWEENPRSIDIMIMNGRDTDDGTAAVLFVKHLYQC